MVGLLRVVEKNPEWDPSDHVKNKLACQVLHSHLHSFIGPCLMIS